MAKMTEGERPGLLERLARVKMLVELMETSVASGKIDGLALASTHFFSQADKLKAEIHDTVLAGPPSND